jgi:murein DD-endopeptidase / murein LD-carboxypeptidase
MNKYIVCLGVLTLLNSCKSSKRFTNDKYSSSKPTTYISSKKVPEINLGSKPSKSFKSNDGSQINDNINSIIQKALSYKGTKYKYGGTSRSGMDCSGLMLMSFKTGNIILPRTSIAQSKEGVRVSKSSAKKGDLLFFKTSGSKKINHVGLVVSVDNRDVKFVHSSSSRGVMISSLREGYWSNVFSEIRRVNNEQSVLTSGKTNKSSQSTIKYVVKKGDTLYAIARQYGSVSVQNLINYNKLKSSVLTPGMILVIPIK